MVWLEDILVILKNDVWSPFLPVFLHVLYWDSKGEKKTSSSHCIALSVNDN